MLNQCANPKCAKPLHYLREGRIFVFDRLLAKADGDQKHAHRMEHFWLCGDCARTMVLEQTKDGVRVAVKHAQRTRTQLEIARGAMAS